MPKKIIAVLLSLAPLALFAQSSGAEMQSSGIMHFPKTGTLNVSTVTEDYFPKLQHLEMPKPGANVYHDYLQEIKAQINPQPGAEKKSGQRDHLQGPIVWTQ